MKTRKYASQGHNWYVIECPGCKMEHLIAVDPPFSNGARWSFNGNMEKPTFNPSINITYEASFDGLLPKRTCHFFVKDGMISFCGDCTHSLVNQTVELPDIVE